MNYIKGSLDAVINRLNICGRGKSAFGGWEWGSYLVFLSRHKAYTAVNVLGLSLSMMFVILIGTYTWQEYHVNAQYPKADRILVYGMDMEVNGKVAHGSGGNWRLQQHFKARYPEIESSCAIYGGKNHAEWNFTGKDGQRTQYPTLFVDSTFFTLLDIQLVCGDASTALRDPSCAVVTEEFARQHYGSPEKAMGKRLTADMAAFHITGIMRRIKDSSIPEADVVVRYELTKSINPSLTNEHMNNATGAEVLFLEREGAHLESKVGDMDKYQKQFFWIFQLPDMGIHTTLTPLSKYYFTKLDDTACLRQGDGQLVRVLFTVGLVILLFAVFNYINLTNAISSHRMREMAMRRLVGATRRDVIVRIISESVALCAVSMVIALFLAWAATPYTERLLNTEIAGLPLPFQREGSLLHFIVVIAFTCVLGIIAGIMPASIISKAKPLDVVKSGSTMQTASPLLGRMRDAFIVIQNTATIVLIATTFAMSAQIRHMITAYRGYNTNNIIDVPLSFGNGDGDISEKDKSLIDAWYDGLKQLPQVVTASACYGTPYSGGNNETFTYNNKSISSQVIAGDSRFMKLFGLKVLSQTGVRNENGLKVYVNRQMLAEEGLPLDSRFYWFQGKKENICGVLENFTIRTLDSYQHPMRVIIADDSLRYRQWDTAIEVQGDPVTAWESIQKLFKDIFHDDLNIDRPFIDQQIANDYESETRMVTILRFFALIAIVISVLGLVAMSTYYINSRRKEIAVRKVFGSTSGEVSRRFIRRFLAYVLAAFVIATPIIIYSYGSWVAQYSHRASWWQWIPAAGAIVLAVSYAAVAVQVRNASRQNPAANLKAE